MYVALGCVLFSGSFSICTLQGLQCSEHWLFTKSLSCSESTLWRSSAPLQFLNFNIPSTTEGHLRTKYNVKLFFFKSTYLPMHNDTRLGTYLFSVGTHRGNLLVSSSFSTGDLNFCVHSIPLWKNGSCSEHQCIGLLEEHCSNYIMSMLNLQIHQWASSRQNQCGIKQNEYICMYI